MSNRRFFVWAAALFGVEILALLIVSIRLVGF